MSETAPSPVVPVRLIGGPEDWHGTTLDIYTEQELAAPRESLGAYLISDHVPLGHPDPGARAVFEPNARPAPADLWFFRGWVPVGPTDAEHRSPEREADLDVHVDDDGLPVAVVDRAVPSDVIRVVRVLAHWQASGEDHLAPDVWHVLTRDGDWGLFRHLGDRWTGGRLPDLQDHEHEDDGPLG